MSEMVLAPGENRSVALALVNSYSIRPGANPDAIPDTEALQKWLITHGLSIDGRAVTESDVEAVHVLRDHIRALFVALESSTPPAPIALQILNSFSTASPGAPVLEIEDARLASSWRSTLEGPSVALAAIARDAITIAVSSTAERLHTCKAGDCIRMFLPDRASRRWCSAACGDRVRAARHYARSRHQ